MTWNDNVPLITNVVADDLEDINENLTYLLGRDGYRCDASEADQGAAGGGNTLKDLITSIGTSKQATIKLAHSGAGNTTTYTLGTSLDLSSYSNIYLDPEPGALIQPASGKTLTIYSPENIIASPRQQIVDITNNSTDPLVFTVGGTDSHPISPHWFGIDGTADEVQINLAIDAKEDDSVVRLPVGDYSISAEILFTGDRMKLIGYGATITLAANSDCQMFAVDRPNEDQHIEGIKFDGNRANQGAGSWNGIYTGGTDTGEPKRLRIINCRFTGIDNVAINLESPSEVLIDHNHFDNSGYGHVRMHGDDNSVVSNNHFDAADGDYSYMSVSLDGKGTLVTGNTFENVPDGTYAVRLLHDGTNPVRGHKITKNNFIGTLSAGGTGYAISFDHDTYVKNNMIEGNYFYDIQGINSSAPLTKVIGNTFLDCGMPWYPSGSDHDIQFIGNSVSGCTQGLRVKYSNGIIKGNIFHNIDYYGILMEGTENLIVEGNIFRDIGVDQNNTYSVIDLQDESGTESTYNIIKNNICFSDHATNFPDYFIQGSGTPDNNIISNNIIQNVNDYITGILVGHNPNSNLVKNNTGYVIDSSTRSVVKILTHDNIVALASGYELVPAPANGFIEFISAVLEYKYLTAAYTETSAPDELVIRYNTANTEVSEQIDSTAFICAGNSEMRLLTAKAGLQDTDLISADARNKALELVNLDDNFGDTGGTAAGSLRITVNYRIHYEFY